MDNFQLIQFSIITLALIIFVLYTIINVFKLSKEMKKMDDTMETSRKILKRKDSNVYDLKATRRD